DAAGRLMDRWQGVAGGPSIDVAITYNADGLPAVIWRAPGDIGPHLPAAVTTFTYDAPARMTPQQDTGPPGNLLADYSYTYDPADEITSESLSGKPESRRIQVQQGVMSKTLGKGLPHAQALPQRPDRRAMGHPRAVDPARQARWPPPRGGH